MSETSVHLVNAPFQPISSESGLRRNDIDVCNDLLRAFQPISSESGLRLGNTLFAF